jgi:hypothetical protein
MDKLRDIHNNRRIYTAMILSNKILVMPTEMVYVFRNIPQFTFQCILVQEKLTSLSYHFAIIEM